MSKRKGAPYDRSIRETDHGERIYAAWRRSRKYPHCEEWEYFPNFYDWAMESGYEVGCWLRLIDSSGTYCPENCEWYFPEDNTNHINIAWVKKWNRSVNRIRQHYGMPPLEGTRYGD